MRVYLIGYMGSGKSTLGKALARTLNYKFIDLDHFIETGYKKTIPEIFATEGEQRFRELERDFLHQTSDIEDAVISSGGGTPCFFDNMEWMKNHGTTVYLKMTVDGLFNRLIHAKEERPLIKGLSNEEMKLFIKTNIEKREPFYSNAEHIISGENVKPKEVAAFLLNS